MEISIIRKEGFFKIFPTENRVEIASSSFSAKGTIELDETSLKQMIVELCKCKNCPVDSFDCAFFIMNRVFECYNSESTYKTAN